MPSFNATEVCDRCLRLPRF